MRLALMIEGQEDVSWTQWLALAEACEASGVEALFRSDHYLSASDEGRHVLDAWATIAALAARTSTLELGTLVSPATFRHPAVLARLAASADEIAGGRVTLGIGTGWAAREHEAYGIGFFDDRRRVERFREQVEIIHRLLREERVDYRGTHYALHEAPGLVRPAMPIIVGGRARSGTARAAARFADEYNTFFATLTEARERKRALDEECARADRDPATLRYSLMAPCIIGPDVGTVRESANRIGARFGARGADEVLQRARQLGPVGTIEQVVTWFHAVAEMGYERVMLQHLLHDDLGTVDLIGRELAPAIAGVE